MVRVECLDHKNSLLELARKNNIKNVCGAKVDGKMIDLNRTTDSKFVDFLTFDDKEGRSIYSHTTAHILAQAVKRLLPKCKLTIGPSIENGFYYDFDVEKPFDEDDLIKLEEEMHRIVREDLNIERFELSKDEAIKLMEERKEPYKVKMIKNLPKGEVISFYKQGEFVDFCRGPHLSSTGKVNAIKLTSMSSAYWKGDSKNQSLQRVYGISFPSQSELDEYLKNLEEAKQRDHRKLGKDLEIFMTHDLVGKGLPMYLPNGYIIWELLENYIKSKEKKIGYTHVLTPPIGSVELYKTSGHWEHYKGGMFPKMEIEGEEFVIRPMNCPHHMMIYSNRMHSYRDLPIRIGEIARDCRFEASGTLKGIERVRTFCQNDAHLFLTPEQIANEFKKVVNLILDVYKDLNIKDYHFELSLRDPEDKVKYHPDDQMWNSAEEKLRKVLDEIDIDYVEKIGGAAFYGPKLDVQVKPAVGNEYTLSTCQLDFCLPAKFDLKYVDFDGEKKTPVVIHRAVFGSIDRFIAYYLEETKGVLPIWLSPTQVKIIPITDQNLDYANNIYKKLLEIGIRVKVDARSEKMGYKIRAAQEEKIPYMLIVGKKEEEKSEVSVRHRNDGDMGVMPIDKFVSMITNDIDRKV